MIYSPVHHVQKNLAQGIAQHRNTGNDAYSIQAQQKEDRELQEARNRIFPYHLHINTDFLDAAHLISAMLVELPNIAEHSFNTTRRVVSKTFRRQFAQFVESQSSVTTASVDTNRDYILLAAFHISRGEWRKAWTSLKEINILWQQEDLSQAFEQRLLPAIKTTALKCYLFTLGAAYNGVAVSSISENFELAPNVVYNVISTLAYNENLHIAWNAQSPDPKNPVLITSYGTTASAHRAITVYLERLSSVANPTVRR